MSELRRCPDSFPPSRFPKSIAERLTLLRAGLSGARWIDPENYHLTLRFIGDVDGATARDFTPALGEIVAAPFELRLNGLGSFGGGKPRAIFAGIAPSRGARRFAAGQRARGARSRPAAGGPQLQAACDAGAAARRAGRRRSRPISSAKAGSGPSPSPSAASCSTPRAIRSAADPMSSKRPIRSRI